MYLAVSIGLFFIVTALYIVIIDVFTILFRTTGMTQEKARFQAISLLTNSGYTTKESESVVDVLVRRKLARTVMLFGYVFSVTVVSVFINVVMALPTADINKEGTGVLIATILFIAFIFVKRIPAVKGYFNKMIERKALRRMQGDRDNTIILLDEYPKGVLAEIVLNKVPVEFIGKTIKELKLSKEHGVHILMMGRDQEAFSDTISEMQLSQGDRFLVFGELNQIEALFGYENKK